MTEFTTWRSLVDGEEIRDIPDSETAQYQYDARGLSGFVDGETVTSWEDTRVSGVTISGSATYRADGINGNPALEFNGTDDGFDNNVETLDNGPVGIISVVNPVDPIPSDYHHITGRAGSDDDRAHIATVDNEWRGFGGGDPIKGSSDGNIRLVSLWNENTGFGDAILREDGVQTAIESDGENDEGIEAVSVGYEAAGNRRVWNGLIGFVELHEDVSLSELEDREQEVADYWGLSVA